MPILQALILGIVQGLTEFLPVSSSAHLLIFPRLFGWVGQSLAFDTFLHLGTATAILIYFWKDLIKLIKDFFSDLIKFGISFDSYTKEGQLGLFIFVGSLPAAVFGFLLESSIESTFRGVPWVAFFLVLGSIFLFTAEKWFGKKSEDINFNKSIFIGFFQALALFPGVSRSGATISAGMFSGLSREFSARFSFLLSIPVIVGAGLYKVISSPEILANISLFPLLIGFFSSFIVGMFAINLLLSFVKNNKLYVFVVYRILLAAFLIFITLY